MANSIDTVGVLALGAALATSVKVGGLNGFTVDNTTNPPTVSFNGATALNLNSLLAGSGISLTPGGGRLTISSSATGGGMLPVGGTIGSNQWTIGEIVPTSVAANLASAMTLSSTKRCMLINCPATLSNTEIGVDAMLVGTTSTAVPFNATVTGLVPVGADTTFALSVIGGLCSISNTGNVFTIQKVGTSNGTGFQITLGTSGHYGITLTTNSVAGTVSSSSGSYAVGNIAAAYVLLNSTHDKSIAPVTTATYTFGGTWIDGEQVTLTKTFAAAASSVTWTSSDAVTRLS